MRETLTKKIGTNTYKVTQLGAKKGRQAAFRLLKLLGPIGQSIAEAPKADVESLIGPMLGRTAAEANPEDFDYLCDTLAEVSTVSMMIERNGSTIEVDQKLGPVFDEHFAGNYAEMILWLGFAIQVNFTSFLDVKDYALGLGSALGLIPKKS